MHNQDSNCTGSVVDSRNLLTHHEASHEWFPHAVVARTISKSLGAVTHTSVPRTQLTGPVEQSFAQAHLWFIDRLYPESTWYLMPLAIRLRGSLDLDALHAALLALEERHEPLRTTFEHRDGVDLQIVHPFVPKQLKLIHMPGASWEAITQGLHQEHSTPFNLETEPGWRTSLYQLGEKDYVLSIVMHHIISDGWSIGIIQRELVRFYSAASQGQDPLQQVRPLPIQYRDFAVWQKQEAQAAEHQRQLEYWKQQLDSSQPAELLCDKPRPTVLSGVAKEHEVVIEGSLYRDLQVFCKVHQATPFAVLLAAFRAAHYRLTGVEDATIGTPIANRNRQELEDLVGFFINLQCIRTTVKEEEEESFGSLVRQVVSVTAAASAHQDLPFEKIVAAVRQGPRDLSRNPLVQIVFAVHAQQRAGYLDLDGIETEPVGDTKTSRFDLEFHLFHEDHCIRGHVMFSDELFDLSSISCMTSTLFEILRRGLAEPAVPLATMPLTDGHSALTDMGLTYVARTEYPRESSVPALFRQQATLCGADLAVKDASSQLSYAELDQKSDELAYWLAQRGHAAETLIGVLAPRSCEAIVAFLGILKANLAYLPLDVNVPLGRLESILSTVEGDKLVLLGAEVAVPATQLKDVQFMTIAAAQDQQARTRQSTSALLPTPSATSLAYVMFTSGSTGRPKGVMIEHRGIVRLVRDTNIASQSQAAVPVAHIANLAFDAATWEIYVALLNGGSLICVDYMTVLDPTCLGKTFLRHGITAAYFAPSLLKQLLSEAASAICQLELLVIGGEILRPQDASNAQVLVPGNVYNCYGNTENTGFTTIYRLRLSDSNVNGVPIGQTISNSGALVMDSQQLLVPLGIMGEIVLIGDGLARGYTDPTLDCDRFVQVTINGESVKAYRTGDRARYRPADGQLEFFGRMDHQVKIRGHRVELAEVEQALLRDRSVQDVIVLTQELEEGETELICYVTLQFQYMNGRAENQVQLDVKVEDSVASQGLLHQKAKAHLRAMLQVALPSYMIPARIIILDEMPLNLNGKVDRRALATLALSPTEAQGPRIVVPPRNVTEQALCEEFTHVLGLEVGITDNFFDLGGHSLLATRLLSRVKIRMDWDIILRDLYQHSTPEALYKEMTSRINKNQSPEQTTSFIEVHSRRNSRATLVLIHGFWGSGNVFADLVPLVADIFEVVIIHDPFFGSPKGPQTIQDWAVFYLTALKARISSESLVILGGYSLGGLIAFQMASVWNTWWDIGLASVILFDPGTFQSTDIDKLDSTAIDKEVKYGLELFGQDQKANVLQQFQKLGPLLLSMKEQPRYHGNGLYVSTNETVETGVSEWWGINYSNLQTHHVSTCHHTLFKKTLIKDLSKVINLHCSQSLKVLHKRHLDLAFHNVTKRST